MGTKRCRASFGLVAVATVALAGCNLGVSRQTIDVSAEAVVAADLNGDGLTDLVSAGDNTVAVLLATTSGSFGVTRYDVVDVDESIAYKDVALADADADGDDDVVVIWNYRSIFERMSVLENQGDGVLGEPQLVVNSLLASGITAGDVDGDQIDDIVVSGNSGEGFVLTGDGAGGYVLDPDAPQFVANDVEIADVDGNGMSDLVVASTFSSSASTPVVEVYRQNAMGWAPPEQFAADTAEGRAQALALADIDGDSVIDVVAANELPSGGSVSVLLGHGDGTFGAPVVTSGILGILSNSQLGTADVDADGVADVVLAHAGGVRVMFGDGTGALGDAHGLVPTDGAAYDLEVLDVDGDDVDDVVSAGTKINVFVNRLDGARTHP